MLRTMVGLLFCLLGLFIAASGLVSRSMEALMGAGFVGALLVVPGVGLVMFGARAFWHDYVPAKHFRACTHCREFVHEEATVCRHCGRDLIAEPPAAKPRT